MKLRLDTEKVENYRRRLAWTPRDIAAYLGVTRQGYLDMIKRKSAARSKAIAKLFNIDEEEIVKIEK